MRDAASIYYGDPSVLANIGARLHHHGQPLRVLTIGTTPWPSTLLAALNRTYTGRVHGVLSIRMANLQQMESDRNKPGTRR